MCFKIRSCTAYVWGRLIFVCKWNLCTWYTTSIIYLQFIAMLFFWALTWCFFLKMWKLLLSLRKWHHNFCQTDEETKVLQIQPQVKDCKTLLNLIWIERLKACDQFSPWGNKHIPPIWCFYLIVFSFLFFCFKFYCDNTYMYILLLVNPIKHFTRKRCFYYQGIITKFETIMFENLASID